MVILLGRVGQDPEIRATSNGKRYARFSLATSEVWNDDRGQEQERTQWHNIQAWGGVVDVIERWVKKGDRLYITGKIEYHETDDGRGGKKYFTNIIMQRMNFVSGGKGGDNRGGGGGGYQPQASATGGTGGGGQTSRQPAPSPDDPDDDLPF